MDGVERMETVIVGGGQAGLAVGYHLARRDRPFVILDAGRRVGDAWRRRWDSLRLFTPARYSGLPGMPFPAPASSYPTKDQVADYLEAYAARFDLPVRTGVRVDRLSRVGDRYLLAAGDRRYQADHVVLASGAYQRPRIPTFAEELDPGILQLDPYRYRNPSQLPGGGVLVVGAGNSGAEIAFEVAGSHPTWLSGPDTGHLPVRTGGAWDRLLTPPFWWFASRVLTVQTPIGRTVRPKALTTSAALERVRPKELAAAKVQRVPRTVGSGTASRCWRTGPSWRWRQCCGAPGSGPTSPSSTCRSSTRTGCRCTTAAWSAPSRACTFWGCGSCRGSPPRCWAGSAGTPSTSPNRSPPARRSSRRLEDKMVNPRVLVVGGGIAGLATARALLQRGIEPDVVERAAAWSHPGAGMYLPANAVRALGMLGLQAALLDHACVITRQRFLDHRGRELLDVDLPAVWGATGPCAASSHHSLHELLRAGIPVRLGRTVTALDDQGPLVRAVFDDGSTGDYDLVVGADGVRSWVRTVVLGGATPRLLGQASWRFLVDGVAERSAWTVRLGRGKAFLTIPVEGGRVYCYADVAATGPSGRSGRDPAGLVEQFGEFAEPVPTILQEGLAGGDPPYFAPIEEVAQRPWVRGRVVLVGDAAHAMSPNMAEGAGMALEDALVLAEVIAADRPLAEFEARRRPRVGFVQTQTHRRDRTRNLSPVVRSAVLRLAGQRIFRGNYHALLGEP